VWSFFINSWLTRWVFCALERLLVIGRRSCSTQELLVGRKTSLVHSPQVSPLLCRFVETARANNVPSGSRSRLDAPITQTLFEPHSITSASVTGSSTRSTRYGRRMRSKRVACKASEGEKSHPLGLFYRCSQPQCSAVHSCPTRRKQHGVYSQCPYHRTSHR
jgi:hypothetical protein